MLFLSLYIVYMVAAVIFVVKVLTGSYSSFVKKGLAIGAWALAAVASSVFALYSGVLYYSGIASPEVVWGILLSAMGVILTLHPLTPLGIIAVCEEED